MFIEEFIVLNFIVHVIYGQVPEVSVAAQDASGVLNQISNVTCLYTANTGTFLSAAWYNGTSTGSATNELVHSIVNPTNGRYSIDVTQPGIATLIITDTPLSDEGYYSCLVNNDRGRSNSDTASLVVHYFSSLTFTITNNPVTVDSSTVLNCSVDAKPDPLIILTKDGQEFSRATAKELVHRISNVEESDAGTYRCQATNDAGSMSSELELDVQYIHDVTIKISSTEDPHFTMTCFVNSNAVPQLKLYHNDSIIITKTAVMLNYTRSPVSDDDNGQYYCEASRPDIAGTVESSILTLEYYKPQFDLPEYMVVDSGDDVMIAIDSMSANPSDVSFQWTIDDPDVRDTDNNPTTFSFVASGGDKTTYVISVNVSNVIGSKKDSITIIVSACNGSPVHEPRDESSKGLTVGMVFVGIIIGALGVIVGQVGYTKIKQKKLTENKGERKAEKKKRENKLKENKGRKAEKKKQETYMEYMCEPCSPTYQDLQHGVQEESDYVNVKKKKNNKP